MFRYLAIFGILSFSFLLIVGCGNTNKVVPNSNSVNENRERPEGTFFASSTNRLLLKREDLKVADKIMVMGTSNSDGTITASQIILGDFINNPGFRRDGSTSTPEFNNTGSPSSSVSGQQLDRRQFGRQGGALAGRGNAAGLARLSGEIIKLEENNLVLKIQDGGSKIVYFSDKTEIFKMNPPEPNSATTTGQIK